MLHVLILLVVCCYGKVLTGRPGVGLSTPQTTVGLGGV